MTKNRVSSHWLMRRMRAKQDRHWDKILVINGRREGDPVEGCANSVGGDD